MYSVNATEYNDAYVGFVSDQLYDDLTYTIEEFTTTTSQYGLPHPQT